MIDFKEYIHNIRSQAIEKIKTYLIQDNIKVGLEVGAGDGFQSKLIVEYLDRLVVTEYDKDRLQQLVDKRIEYVIADAEAIESSLSLTKFDLVFSSHLLEHLPNPEKLVKSSYNLIGNEGLVIHIVPSLWYAVFRSIFYYPSLIVRVKRKLKQQKSFDILSSSEHNSGNNLKIIKKKRRKVFEFIFPRPHGVSKTVIHEIFYLRKKIWTRLFKSNQLEIINIINGECFSGYGFGLERSKRFLSKLGIACEYIYILRKGKYD